MLVNTNLINKGWLTANHNFKPNKSNTMRKFAKYQQNLSHDYEFIYSYKTKVAKITDDGIVKLGYWSMTTSKHINYTAKQLNMSVK